MRMKLRDTFQVLNDLGGEVCEIQQDLRTWNSVRVELKDQRTVDPRALMTRYEHLLNRMVEVKVLRTLANVTARTLDPVEMTDELRTTQLFKVNLIQELKSYAKFLDDMAGRYAQHGRVARNHRGFEDANGAEFVEYDAVFKTTELRDRLRRLRRRIRGIQCDLDVFNTEAEVKLSFDSEAA